MKLCLVQTILVASFTLAADVKMGDPRFVGRWTCEPNQFTKVTTTLLPDGRYFAVITVAGVDQPQRGRYRIDGDKITFEVQGVEKPSRYGFKIKGDALTVIGTEIGDMAYRRVPGSDKAVLAEAQAADAAKAKEDEQWRQRLAVAPMLKQPPHVAVGMVPADPKPQNVFDQPTVFSKQQLYLRQNQTEYIHRNNNPPGVFHTHFHWYFLSTGRIYVQAISYSGVTLAKERQSVAGTYYIDGKTENKQWGRYRIDAEEQAQIEFDDGSKLTLKLIDGRRNLDWNNTLYGNVEWELEALKQYQQKK